MTLERPKLRGTDEAFASRLFGTAVPHQRAGVAGHRRVRPGPVGPRRGGHPGRRARPRGGAVQVDGLPGLRGDQGRVRGLARPGIWTTSSSTTCSWTAPLQVAPRCPAEPVLAAWGITTDGKPGVRRPGPGQLGVHRRLGRLPRRARRPGAAPAAAGHLRRRAGLIGARRGGAAPLAAPAMPDPPGAERPGQGAQERPGRDEGRVLGDLDDTDDRARRRRRSPRPATRIAAFAERYGASLPRRGQLPASPTSSSSPSTCASPSEHQKRIRHSNFIERTFGETRRRVKVIGRLPGERSCLNLVWAVLDRASRGWRGVSTRRPPPACSPTCAASSSTRLDRTDDRHEEVATTPSQPSRNITNQEPASVAFYTVSGTPPNGIEAHETRLDSAVQQDDRSGVVGAAKELCECVASVVCAEQAQTISTSDDFAKVITSAHEALDRRPGRGAAVEGSVRNIAQSARKIAIEVNTLRNEAGTGHGRSTVPIVTRRDGHHRRAGGAALVVVGASSAGRGSARRSGRPCPRAGYGRGLETRSSSRALGRGRTRSAAQ